MIQRRNIIRATAVVVVYFPQPLRCVLYLFGSLLAEHIYSVVHRYHVSVVRVSTVSRFPFGGSCDIWRQQGLSYRANDAVKKRQ